VADAFIGVAQAFGVVQAGFVEHHGILKRRAAREAGVPEPRHFIHEAEGAGARNIATEAFGAEIERKILAADRGIGEIDFDLGAEPAGIGAQLAKTVRRSQPAPASKPG